MVAAFEALANGLLTFVNYGITILTVLAIWEGIKFVRGPGGAAEERGIEKVGEKFRSLKTSLRRADRAFRKVYRVDKKLIGIIGELEKLIAAGATATPNMNEIDKKLKAGRDELKREGEVLIYIHDIKGKIDSVADATVKTDLTTKFDKLEKLSLAKFANIKSKYTSMEKAIGKPDWAKATKQLGECKRTAQNLADVFLGMEAIEKQITK